MSDGPRETAPFRTPPTGRALRSLVAQTARALPRGVALFFGAFAVVNVARSPAANLWWIDLRGLPATVSALALTLGGIALAVWALWPRERWVAGAAVAASAAFGTAAVFNGLGVLELRRRGVIATDPVPLSFVVAALFTWTAWTAYRASRDPAASATRTAPWRVAVLCAAVAVAGVFPIAQQVTYGRTDYLRDTDVIVVFGARTHADGRASVALSDRVRTACDVWSTQAAAGHGAPTLFLSGGPGDGSVHETEAMRAIALARGVPDASIVLDPSGVSSLATVTAVGAWTRARGPLRVVAVSHAYHLPRVRLEFDREGVAAVTLPARESRTLPLLPWYSIREVAAWWTTWAVRPSRGAGIRPPG